MFSTTIKYSRKQIANAIWNRVPKKMNYFLFCFKSRKKRAQLKGLRKGLVRG